MQGWQRTTKTRAEESSTRTVCLRWVPIQKVAWLLVFLVLVISCIVCWTLHTQQYHLKPTEHADSEAAGGFTKLGERAQGALQGQEEPHCSLESPGYPRPGQGSLLGAGQGALWWTEQDIAELHLNYTGPRQDRRLLWKGDPALGRSFLHGPQLDNGQLCVQRDGIYRLHIQVTLANCSFSSKNTESQRAVLAVGICSPATHSITLLRLNFHLSCTVASQRLTPLVHGDTLCTNLTLPLEPSQNADETFFGVHWVHP